MHLERVLAPARGVLDDFSKSAASKGFYREPKDCKAAPDRAEQLLRSGRVCRAEPAAGERVRGESGLLSTLTWSKLPQPHAGAAIYHFPFLKENHARIAQRAF